MTSLVTFTSAPAILGGKRDSEELLCAVGCVNLCQNKSTIGTSPDPLSPREGLASETNHLLPLHSLFSSCTSQDEEVAITQESSATCHSCSLHSTPRKVHLVKKAPVLAMGEGHVCSCMPFMHTLLP